MNRINFLDLKRQIDQMLLSLRQLYCLQQYYIDNYNNHAEMASYLYLFYCWHSKSIPSNKVCTYSSLPTSAWFFLLQCTKIEKKIFEVMGTTRASPCLALPPIHHWLQTMQFLYMYIIYTYNWQFYCSLGVITPPMHAKSKQLW